MRKKHRKENENYHREIKWLRVQEQKDVPFAWFTTWWKTQKNAEVVFIQGSGLYFPKVNKKKTHHAEEIGDYVFISMHTCYMNKNLYESYSH